MFKSNKSSSVRFLGGFPKVIFTPKVIKDIETIVDICNDEVGWLGVVKQKKPNEYLIEKILITKQEVHSSTCEMMPEGLHELADILDIEELGCLKFWGHSHHDMGVSPSSQDNEQAESLVESSEDIFIRGIFNKKGEVGLSFYDKRNKIIIDDIPFTIDIGIDDYEKYKKEWEAVIEKNVSKMSFYNNDNNSKFNYYNDDYYNDSFLPDYYKKFGKNDKNHKKKDYQDYFKKNNNQKWNEDFNTPDMKAKDYKYESFEDGRKEVRIHG
mgnify:CR=1 FL=1